MGFFGRGDDDEWFRGIGRGSSVMDGGEEEGCVVCAVHGEDEIGWEGVVETFNEGLV